MGRIQSKRIIANTQVVPLAATLGLSVSGYHNNPCVFNGILINVKDTGSVAAGQFDVMSNHTSLGPIVGTFNGTANTFASDPAGAFKNKNLKVGDLLLLGLSTANDGIKEITAIDAAGTTLTFASISGTATEPVEFTPLRMVASFNVDYATDYSKDKPTIAWNYTNGILCQNGLYVSSSSWTNFEAYVLHS